MKDWIDRNRSKVTTTSSVHYNDDGEMVNTIRAQPFSACDDEVFLEDVLTEDMRKFKEESFDVISNLDPDQYILGGQFQLYLVKKYPGIRPDGPKCKTIFVEPLKPISMAIKPYLNNLDKFSIIRYSRGYSWNRQSKHIGREFANVVDDFCGYAVEFKHGGFTIKTPQLGRCMLKNDMTRNENLQSCILDHVTNITNFLKIMTNMKYQKYMTECIDSGCVISQDMQISNFKKFVTFMNDVPVENAIEYSQTIKFAQEYIEPEDEPILDSMLTKVKRLRLDKLASFAVTVHGVQFKITNLSGSFYLEGFLTL